MFLGVFKPRLLLLRLFCASETRGSLVHPVGLGWGWAYGGAELLLSQHASRQRLAVVWDHIWSDQALAHGLVLEVTAIGEAYQG